MTENLIPADGKPEEVWTSERCYILEWLNDPRSGDLSVAECRVEPGVTTELHRLSVSEWYLIREGRGRMQVGDADPFEVGPGDTIIIPADAPQCIENIDDTDLIFVCVCQPRFTPCCYEALE